MTNNFWNEKNVLITGGTSFVGKNLVQKLNKLNTRYFVFGKKEFDLTKSEQSNAVMQVEGIKYDFIFHMAALQAAADWPMHHTGIQFYKNMLIHTNTLESWRKFHPRAKMIAIGSSCLFPGGIHKLREKDVDDGALHESVYSYGFTKKAALVGLKAYKDQYELQGTMPMFATLYGPQDDFNPKTAHVVSALIAKFCNAKLHNLPEVQVWGDGTQTRELIYVEDQIEGLLMAAQYYSGDAINIGSGIETTIRDLAETIRDITGYEGEIVYNTNKFVGVKHKVLDISKAKDLFGWTVNNRLHSLEEGLSKSVNWYTNNIL